MDRLTFEFNHLYPISWNLEQSRREVLRTVDRRGDQGELDGPIRIHVPQSPDKEIRGSPSSAAPHMGFVQDDVLQGRVRESATKECLKPRIRIYQHVLECFRVGYENIDVSSRNENCVSSGFRPNGLEGAILALEGFVPGQN